MQLTAYTCVLTYLHTMTGPCSTLQGRPINDIDHYGCNQWPDMQDLINHCLQYMPTRRPSAQEIFERMCSSEFAGLRRAVPIERDHTVETFTIRVRVAELSGPVSHCTPPQSYSSKHNTKHTEVWVVSILGTQSMVSASCFSYASCQFSLISFPSSTSCKETPLPRYICMSGPYA